MPEKGESERARLRRAKVLVLRTRDKLSLREIAVKVDVSHTQVVRDIAKAIDKINKPILEEVQVARTKENRKLDLLEILLFHQLMPEESEGKGEIVEPELNIDAFNAFLRLAKRRAELNGLDMPSKLTLTDPKGNALGVIALPMETSNHN